MMLVPAGTVDVTTYFHLRLAADGTDATGLTIANMDLTYVRTREEPSAKVDAQALADQDTAHTDNFAIEVDGTNMPGVYRVDWPDAAFAAGDEVILTVKCATVFTESLRVKILSATRGLAGTALPNAAADAAGGLPISDAGGLDLDAQVGTKINDILTDTGTTLQAEVDGIQADTEDIQARLPAALTAGGNMKSDALAISGDTTAADNLETAFDDTAGPVPHMGIIDQGTAQSISGVDFVGRAAAAFGDDTLNGCTIAVLGSTQGYWQVNTIVDTALAGDAYTLAAAFPVTPTGTITYKIFASASASAAFLAAVADAVWEEDLSDHSGTAGSVAEALNAAGAAGDPWTTALPGAYGAGSAGNILGNRLVGTIATGTHNPQSGDAFARLGAPAGASVSADILAIDNLVDDLESRVGTPSNLGGGATLSANLSDIEAQTDDIGAAGAGLTALATAAELAKVPKSDGSVSWNATAAAQLQLEANDALVANKLDHLVAVADADDPVDNSIIAKLATKGATADWSSFDNTTDSLEANRDNIGAAGAGLTAADDTVVTAVAALDTKIGTPSNLGGGATLSGNLSDIESQTDDIGVAGAGLTAAGITAAQVRTALGLASANLDTQLDALPTAVENADALLGRTISGGANGNRTVTSALRVLRNRKAVAGGTLTVYQEDDVTPDHTAAVTTAAGNPVSEVDPAT